MAEEEKPKEIPADARLRLELDKTVETIACPTVDTLKTAIEKKALSSIRSAKSLDEAEIIFNLAKFRTDLCGLLDEHCKAIPKDREKILDVLGIKKPVTEEVKEKVTESIFKPKEPITKEEKLIKPKEEIKIKEVD